MIHHVVKRQDPSAHRIQCIQIPTASRCWTLNSASCTAWTMHGSLRFSLKHHYSSAVPNMKLQQAEFSWTQDARMLHPGYVYIRTWYSDYSHMMITTSQWFTNYTCKILRFYWKCSHVSGAQSSCWLLCDNRARPGLPSRMQSFLPSYMESVRWFRSSSCMASMAT